MIAIRIAPLLLCCGSILLFAKTPITHEALWAMKRTGAPAPSPDGKWVAFSVTEPAYDEKDQRSDLWIVPGDGSAKPRQLTYTKGGESGVAWSPDSRRIAFSARRDGDEAGQIYVIDVAGGEAVRFTTLSTGASGPQWSPDGKQLLFSANVYPGAADDEANKKMAAERKGLKYRVRTYESFPIRQWDHWLDDMQAHVFVMAAEAGAKPRDLLAATKLAALPGFAGASGTSGYDLQPVWAPDSRSVVFTATTNKNAGAYANVNTHLYQAMVDGGEPRALTSGEEASYSRPRFRPDGKALYAAVASENTKIYNLERLAMFAWPNPGERTVVTATSDRAVNSYAFAPDSRTVYFTAEDSGLEKIYSVPAAGGEVRPAVAPARGVYANLAIPAKAASTVLIANWGSSVNPAEVVRVSPGAKEHQTLTEFAAAAAAEIDWQPPRHFTFTSKGGKTIHNMIVLPPAFDEAKKYPLLVLMHGGPASMWRDEITLRWNYHLLGSPGYVLLLTNYTGSTGFGEPFAQGIQFDPLRGPGEEINQAADEAIKRFTFIDSSRQAAGGASYGGHLANWMQATTTRYKCLISHAGLINLESQWGTSDTIFHRELSSGGPVWEQGKVWREQNPIRYAAKFRTPMLLSVGENDYRVPLNQTLENWSVLQRLRIPSRLLVWPEENHWILKGENSRQFYREVHFWLKKYL